MSVVTELKLYNKHQLVGYDHYDSLGCDWGCVFKWELEYSGFKWLTYSGAINNSLVLWVSY